MAIVSLSDNQRRTQFFQETTLLNLEYWQAWLAQVNSANITVVNLERNSIVRAILFGLDLGQVAWSTTYSLVTTFSTYMERGGHWEVWHGVLRRAIRLAESTRDKAGMVGLSALLARLLFQQNHFQEACRYYRQTIHLARQTGDRFSEARACSNLGYHYVETGQWYRAEVLCCHALDLFAQIDSQHGLAHTHNHLGCLYLRQEQWSQAEQHLQQACAIWQQLDDRHGLMRGYINLGALYLDTDCPGKVLLNSRKALEFAQLTGDKLAVGTIYINIGQAYRLKQEYAKAETHLRRAETIFQDHANARGLALMQDNLGLVYLEQQCWPEAEFYLKSALAAWRTLDSKYNEIQAITYLAEYELARGHSRQSSLYLAEAEQLLNRYDRPKRFYSHWNRVDKCRRSLHEAMSGQTTATRIQLHKRG
ncbi:MAG: tetratricopeptide repeat protein [Anaerolineae bacterium]|nr:tetratricopeptide repeat protein [Anaerolineae bacterium]